MVEQKKIIKFSDLGETFGTRLMAKNFRKQIEDLIDNNLFIVFDFSDVRNISDSFADECFGVLIEKYSINHLKKISTFTNMNSFVSLSIKDVINRRANALVAN